jgi:N-acetylmuramic acid 6-phosphate etherase
VISGNSMTESPYFLGVEGGGTHTTALLVGGGKPIFEGQFGPGNVRLLDERMLEALCRKIQSAIARFPTPGAIGFGMAGARTTADQARVARIAAGVWKTAAIRVGNDLDIALDAAPQPKQPATANILVLSGTGSCCSGRNVAGQSERVGGWGHHLGDEGSGYSLGQTALQQAVHAWDRHRSWGALGSGILTALQLNEPNQLIGWVQTAEKKDVARLATVLFEAAAADDRLAKSIVQSEAGQLATDALIVAGRLAGKSQRVQFIFYGSVLLKADSFARAVARVIRKARPNAVVTRLERSAVWGSVAMAEAALGERDRQQPSPPSAASRKPAVLPCSKPKAGRTPESLSPTELRHPASTHLDQMPVDHAVELFLLEDASITAALLAEKQSIAKVVGWIARAFKNGGRLFYVGAGTSGRLGILDASECPPTFRTPPELVEGIIAGGREAIWRAVEGAEDDPVAGARSIEFRGITEKDVVVGIAASGRTPFVRGALTEAKRRRARNALLCFNPHVYAEKPKPADLVIAPDIGPELLTGSTRLKSGTATKLVLNIFTTLAMVRTGKVIGNLMVDVNPSNVKLRGRAIRIVRDLTGADAATVLKALEASGWIVRDAWLRLGGDRKRR